MLSEETCAQIIELHQKLKTLRTELDAELLHISDEAPGEKKIRLMRMSSEVDEALRALEPLMALLSEMKDD